MKKSRTDLIIYGLYPHQDQANLIKLLKINKTSEGEKIVFH